MPERRFLCPSCTKPARMHTVEIAESPEPLGYICDLCGANLTELPDEVEIVRKTRTRDFDTPRTKSRKARAT
jgi:hypothetical protein